MGAAIKIAVVILSSEKTRIIAEVAVRKNLPDDIFLAFYPTNHWGRFSLKFRMGQRLGQS